MLWAIILLTGAFGCGNGSPDSVSLPNNYTLSFGDWGETWVEDRSGERIGDRHFSILECEVENDLFFGVYHEDYRNDQRIRAYFIIDTARDKYQPFIDKDKWKEALRDLGGVENAKLVQVSAFASRDELGSAKMLGRIIFTIAIGTLLFIALVAWGYERARRRLHTHRL